LSPLAKHVRIVCPNADGWIWIKTDRQAGQPNPKMSINEPGHLNNLSVDQKAALASLWQELWSVETQNEVTGKPNPTSGGVMGGFKRVFSTKSLDGPIYSMEHLDEELLFAIGSDDPDMLALRFLRARKWDVAKARQMLVKCMLWRKEFGLQKLLADPEGEIGMDLLQHGKAYFYGKDVKHRCISWADISLHTPGMFTNEAEQKLIIYMLESGRKKFIPEESEVLTLIFDMSNYTSKNQDLSYTKFLVSSLEAYYPETLGQALIVDAPSSFQFFWKLIRPLLDDVVKQKISFVKSSEITETVPAKFVPKEWGGESTYKFHYNRASEKEREHRAVLAADTAGQAKAKQAWNEAGKAFIQVTKKWSQAPAKYDQERQAAKAHLKDAFHKVQHFVLGPSHFTRTH